MKILPKSTFLLVPLLLFMLFNVSSMAQKSKIKPLYLFLQENADSTIIFKYESNWITSSLELKIISKKNDTITRYVYKSAERSGRMPKVIRDTLSKIHKSLDPRNGFVKLHSIDVNEFFNALYTHDKLLKAFWQELQHLAPWTLNDDKVEGEGCQGDANQIYDGGGISLFLITKKEIKQLYFYAPDFYNKICPDKKGRKAILEIEKIFIKNFK